MRIPFVFIAFNGLNAATIQWDDNFPESERNEDYVYTVCKDYDEDLAPDKLSWFRYSDGHCEWYIQCGEATIYVKRCGEDGKGGYLMLNEELAQCDYDYNIPPPCGTKIDGYEEAVEACSKSEINGFYGNRNECQEYWVCRNGKLQPMKCPDGYKFDSDSKICTLDDYVTCGNKVYGNKIETHSTAFCLNKVDGDYAYPGMDDYFIKCWKQIGSRFPCPSGMRWDENFKRCDLVLNTDDKLTKAACEGRQEPGFYQLENGDACVSFLRCVLDGQQLIGAQFRCPATLYFNVDSLSCVWPEDLEGAQCRTFKMPFTTKQRIALDEYILTADVKQSTEEAAGACSGENGLIRSKQLCHRYHKCESGSDYYSFDCPQVLLFDQNTTSCVDRDQLDQDDPCF